MVARTVRFVDEEAVKRKLVPGMGRVTIRILLQSHDLKQERENTNLFAVVEPKAGRRFNYVSPNRSAAHFALVIQRLVAAYPFARKIHLAMDNL